MIVLICGSRDWQDVGAIRDRVAALVSDHPGENVEIIHGDARGADHGADIVARDMGLRLRRFPARWKEHGKRAGVIRNVEMLDERPDLVLAFQLDGSRGTQHTIDEARKRSIAVEVHT